MISIPDELKNYFSKADIQNYPFIKFPQNFVDERGTITNVADGLIGDIAVITSKPESVRANHYHKTDWHITYLINGSFEYFWKDLVGEVHSVIVRSGEGVLTVANEEHKMIFSEVSTMLAISRNSRLQENYEADTIKVEL